MELDSELSAADRARWFWSSQDIDSIFSEVQNQLNQLQTRLRTGLGTGSAADSDLEQSLKLLEAFDWPFVTTPPVVQVVIGSEPETTTAPPVPGPNAAAVCVDVASVAVASLGVPAVGGVSVAVASVVPQYQEHHCSQSCVPTLPTIPESRLIMLNPLTVPFFYGFRRSDGELDQSERGVAYTAPCGLRLCNHDDVMDFLSVTESLRFLQSELFSFSSCVCVDSDDPGPGPVPDLSRGQELTPVELCVSEGQRLPVFKYRRDRWPRGCFLSDITELYRSFCDCEGRCGAEGSCPCISMTTGHGYKHGRLHQPNDNGIYECGPWCGCDPELCQNRVVQRGLRVRLQVFKTTTGPTPNSSSDPSPDPNLDQSPDRGWGVRCKDDLDEGTFICVYAGVVLQRGEGQTAAPPPKQRKAELTADDEIQLVTEWLPNMTPNADSAHVPVIQRGSDTTDQVSVNGSKRGLDFDRSRTLLIDATNEGNVGRFFNHSCEPTLFIQNVFTDSHDNKFPQVAFFTKRALKAGTELTWDYNSAPWQDQEVEEGEQEVPCLCRSAACRQSFHVTEMKKLTTCLV